MNPYTFIASNITSVEEPRCAALKYLCDLWAPDWTPAAYMNPVQVVFDRVQALPASPLRHEMATYLHSRMNTGVGTTFTP